VYAALNGHFEELQWAKENGCPWDEDDCAIAQMRYCEVSNGREWKAESPFDE